MRRSPAGGITIDHSQLVGVAYKGIFARLDIFSAGTVILEIRTIVLQFLTVRLCTAPVGQFIPRGCFPGVITISSSRRDGPERNSGRHLVFQIDVRTTLQLRIISYFLREGSVFIEPGKRTILAL